MAVRGLFSFVVVASVFILTTLVWTDKQDPKKALRWSSSETSPSWSKESASPCLPQHLHLSSASDVDEDHLVSMTISFTLEYNSCEKATASIVYGRVDKSSGQHRTNTTERLQFDFAGYLQHFSSSWIHHVRLEQLQGGMERYWYQVQVVVDDSTIVSSPTYTFPTPPLPSSPTRIALVGDWGGTANAVDTMQSMLNRTHHHPDPLSAVIVAGDLSYANSHLPSWEQWLEKMEPLFRSTPLMVAPGNHEIECDRQTFEIFKAYESYFRNPNRLGPAKVAPAGSNRLDCSHPSEFLGQYDYGNSFYVVRHGLLQVIVLNSYTNTTKGSVQYNWFHAELKSIDRKVTPWLLVVFHCPFHTTYHGHNNEFNPKLMMQNMEPLLVKYGVNLVVSGHNHAYVRTYSMVGSKVDVSRRGPVYLTVGTGGDSHSKGPLQPIPETWVARRDHSEYGFGELHVLNATHAHLERILNNGKDANPEARDEIWFVNQWSSV